MTNEQQYFLTILSDHLQERATQPPPADLDWAQVAACAKSHQVEAIVYHQCRDWLTGQTEPGEVPEQLSRAYAAALFYHANNQAAYSELKALYAREKCPFFMVKGLVIAQCYPVPALRTMGDMDIVLRTEDRERTHQGVLDLGYRYKPGYLVKCYHRGGQALEIHDRLAYEDEPNQKVKAFLDSCWAYTSPEGPEGTEVRLDWNFHFVFLVCHLYKHFSNGGVGFRQFMDLAAAVRHVTLDWEWITARLEDIGLYRFAATALGFCEAWWGIRAPVRAAPPTEQTMEASTAFIFKNGVFGFDNADREVHAREKLMRGSRLPRPLRPLALMVKRICIPYREAVGLSYCSFLRGRKYLLPAAWIYRVFYVSFRKKGHIHAEGKRVFGSQDILDAHSALMDQWGI